MTIYIVNHGAISVPKTVSIQKCWQTWQTFTFPKYLNKIDKKELYIQMTISACRHSHVFWSDSDELIFQWPGWTSTNPLVDGKISHVIWCSKKSRFPHQPIYWIYIIPNSYFSWVLLDMRLSSLKCAQNPVTPKYAKVHVTQSIWEM